MIEITSDAFQYIGGRDRRSVPLKLIKAPGPPGCKRLLGEIILTIVECLHRLESEQSEADPSTKRIEWRQPWYETFRLVDHGNADIEPIILAAQPSR